MWTPRRIMLALAGLVVFAVGYFAYSNMLGGYDGLPALPESFREPPPGVIIPPALPAGNSTDQKLEYIFGRGCPEALYPIKIEMRAKGMLIAAKDFRIIKEGERAGWVELTPLSVAILGKKRLANGLPEEFNTLYCDIAYIQFEKPVRSLTELDGRKVVYAELIADPALNPKDPRKGIVRVVNNRKTPDRADDVELVTPGPVHYYAEPKKGSPHIFTGITVPVKVTDHQNTNLPNPDPTYPRIPTLSGLGLRVYLADEQAVKAQPKKDPRVPPKKDAVPVVSGVQAIEIDSNVEMNLWTDSSASLTGTPAPKKGPEPKKEVPKTPPTVAKKDPTPEEKKLLQIKTNGPFRYDMVKELAHFERPAVQRPGLVEHVIVTRTGRTVGLDVLDCEYMDVFFQRRKAPPPPAKGAPAAPPPKTADTGKEGDLEVKTIRAWGETVVITSDSEKLNATGVELIHEANEKTTVLKGSEQQPMFVFKDGSQIVASELHMFGGETGITQAHVLGPGRAGFGDIDVKSGEYTKQAYWSDRLVYQTVTDKAGKKTDIMTFIGRPGKGEAVFRDTASGEVQRIEADQLKTWMIPKEDDTKKPDPKKPPPPKKKDGDATGAVKPTRVEATGTVSTVSPDMVIKRADYLNILFKDVEKLVKPPAKEDPKKVDPKKVDPKAVDPKKETPKKDGPPTELPKKSPDPVDKKDVPDPTKKEPDKIDESKKEEPRRPAKLPLIMVARRIEATINRDPLGRTEMDTTHAETDVDVHQDPTADNEGGIDIRGRTLDMKAYPEGNHLIVFGDRATRKDGMVRYDKLTIYGFDIDIDQRSNTAKVKEEGSMEMLSSTDLEGKKLEKPSMMTVYWTRRMDFAGTDKQVFYHGAVKAYQVDKRMTCEWMEVNLDRPVYLNQAMKPKEPPKAVDPKTGKKPDDSPKIDTVMCYHLPKEDNVPRPKNPQPVIAIEEIKENGKTVRYQQVKAPELMTVNTPKDGITIHDMTANSIETMLGEVLIWQAGTRDAEGAADPKKVEPKKEKPVKKKGELAEDEEMKLTIVQFGDRMKANDFRKRAIFFKNVKVLHFPSDRPDVNVKIGDGDIPKGAYYIEARETFEVFQITQREEGPKGKPIDVNYSEMKAVGNVRVRKEGEFFGDADRLSYSESKGVMILYGTKTNPAVVNKHKGQGIRDETMQGETIYYYPKTKLFKVEGGTTVSQ